MVFGSGQSFTPAPGKAAGHPIPGLRLWSHIRSQGSDAGHVHYLSAQSLLRTICALYDGVPLWGHLWDGSFGLHLSAFLLLLLQGIEATTHEEGS